MKILTILPVIVGIVISAPVLAHDECGVPPGVLKLAEKDPYKAAQVIINQNTNQGGVWEIVSGLICENRDETWSVAHCTVNEFDPIIPDSKIGTGTYIGSYGEFCVRFFASDPGNSDPEGSLP